MSQWLGQLSFFQRNYPGTSKFVIKEIGGGEGVDAETLFQRASSEVSICNYEASYWISNTLEYAYIRVHNIYIPIQREADV